jgi:mono/diheme cytochrome c family protein
VKQKETRIAQKVILVVTTVAIMMISWRAFSAENQDKWKKYQLEFLELCEGKGPARTDKPSASWEVSFYVLKTAGPSAREVKVPEAGIQDKCITCHLGIDNPDFVDAPQPLRSHPGKILERHSVVKFGCTICHGGKGAATSAEDAHGTDGATNQLIPTKYLQSTCIGCHETSYNLEGAEKFESGRLAFEKFACYACHSTRLIDEKRKFAPPLQDLKKKIKDTRWMISQLRDSRKLNPRTIMPNFELTDEEIRDMVAYIVSLETEREYPKVDLSAAAAEDGEKLYTELGCKACHADKIEEESFRRRLPNLADAGIKLKPDWILEELKNPKELNPDARIPKLDISEEDTAHIIAYLTTLKANADILEAESLTLESASVENGKELVKKFGCYGCHGIQGLEEEKIPGVPVEDTAEKALADLPFGNSETPRTRWDWISSTIETPRHYESEDQPVRAPEFTFDEGEVESLTVFYLNNYPPERPDDYVVAASLEQKHGLVGERIVTERNCHGCHMFEEDVQPRIEKFISLKTYIPPRLIGEGEKVQSEWAKTYLKEPKPMRPWLNMRMPVFFFSEEEIQSLLEYFAVTAPSPEDARIPYVMPIDKESIPQIEIDMGEYRLQFDKCMQCHPVSIEDGLPEDVELEDLSIDLMLSKERLRFEWIKNFMKDPDKYAGAGTKMPYVYYTPEGAPKVSDADMWIDYIAQYLMVMEKVPEPLEEEEPEEEEFDWGNY